MKPAAVTPRKAWRGWYLRTAAEPGKDLPSLIVGKFKEPAARSGVHWKPVFPSRRGPVLRRNSWQWNQI